MKIFRSILKFSAIVYVLIWSLFLLVFLLETKEIGIANGVAVLVVLAIPALPLLFFVFFYKNTKRSIREKQNIIDVSVPVTKEDVNSSAPKETMQHVGVLEEPSFLVPLEFDVVKETNKKDTGEIIEEKVEVHEEVDKEGEWRSIVFHDVSPRLKVIIERMNEENLEAEEKQDFSERLKYTKVRKIVKNFTVLDFETTGFSPDKNKIIQMAAVKYKNFEKVDEFVSFVNPEEHISSRITKINGINDEMVKDAPLIAEILPQLLKFIGDETIVAHNASFDMKFLLTNMINCDIEYKNHRVIDTLQLARKYINDTPNHKLPTLKEYLQLTHLSSHEALHDCYVTGELYKYCHEKSLVNK